MWKNPGFGPELINMQSEETYVADVIIPLFRATLKNLKIGNINLLST